MNNGSERRKHPRRKVGPSQDRVNIRPQNGLSEAGWGVRVLDMSDWGLSVESEKAVEVGSIVLISGKIDTGDGQKLVESCYRVCWHARVAAGSHKLGLSIEPPPSNGHGEAEFVDHYETLQLSSKADSETIHRVFRILAQRYHPDNPETGNAASFREVLEAFRTLGDPERRAAYDATIDQNRNASFRLFDTWRNTLGVEAEKRKRQGILAALYGKRVSEPEKPAMSLRDLEQAIACPREHLEFSLWYLKENGWITRADNARFAITAKGVDVAEGAEVSVEDSGTIRLRLPAAASV